MANNIYTYNKEQDKNLISELSPLLKNTVLRNKYKPIKIFKKNTL